MSLVNYSNLEVVPINGQSTYNSNAGSFNLQFEIAGGVNQALDLNSIRLLAEVDYLTGSGQHLNNNNVYGLGVRDGPGAAGVAAGGVSPAWDQSTQPFVDVDCRTGVNMCINSILWEDAQNNTLENVHGFPHLLNKITSMTMSQDDTLTWGGGSYGLKSGGSSLINQHAINSTQDVALKIYSGLSQSGPMPYSAVSGRVKLSIQLNSSSAVFNGGDNYGAQFGVGTGRAAANGGCFYRLKNVKIVYRNINFDENAPIAQQYAFKHFSSLQSTLSASNNTNIYNPNSSNAISILTSFIPSQNLNNYSQNSVQSGKLKNRTPPNGTIYPDTVPQSVQINTVNLMKNNQLFPLVYPIDESTYTQNNNGNNNYDTQRSYYYMTTIKPFNQLNNTLLHASTEDYGSFLESRSPDFDVSVSAGVGIRYANVSANDGTNFTNGQSFQQRIDSGLDSTLNNEMMSSVLSTKRIVIGSSGPVIIS